MDPFTLGWIVGLLEGEGSFDARKSQGVYSERMQLATTDEDVIRRAAMILETNVNGPYTRKNKPQYKPQWRLHVKATSARQFYELFYPHMSERRQAQITESRRLCDVSRAESARKKAARVYPRKQLHELATHCGRGHLMDEHNTYMRPDGKCRACRACQRVNRRQRQLTAQKGKGRANDPWDGRCLRALREERSLAQAVLAKALGVDQGTISRWEIGKTNPPVSRRPAIYRFFGLTREQFYRV